MRYNQKDKCYLSAYLKNIQSGSKICYESPIELASLMYYCGEMEVGRGMLSLICIILLTVNILNSIIYFVKYIIC